MIDAAGAIYVLGGQGNTGYFMDVWATDGGTVTGLSRGVVGGTQGGTKWGTPGCAMGYSRGTLGVALAELWAHSSGVLRGVRARAPAVVCSLGDERRAYISAHTQAFAHKHLRRPARPQ